MNGSIKGSHLTFGLFIFLVVSLILVAVKPVSGQPTSVITTCDPKNLTGKWFANDGGTYFIRQIGNTIWWVGASKLQEGTTWANVLRGTIYFPPVNNTKIPYIEGNWQDVPLGNNKGEGKLFLYVDPSGQKITKASGENFGGSEWKKNCRTLGDIIKAPPRFVK